MEKHLRDLDYEFALFLQKKIEAEIKGNKNKRKGNDSIHDIMVAPSSKTPKVNLADPHLELIDPTPNIHALFIQFDANFFWKKLGSVAVRWSKRMYSCAGICRYEKRGGMCDIALSEPLLKLRPRKDLIETLLHEMIHAYLFVTNNDRDRDGHGPNFHEHMYRINKAANVNITVYHTFIDEVRVYQTHWWRCNGPCQKWKPFFGIVRRTANRAPGPNDFWWHKHRNECGGTFIKIKEPEKKTKTGKKENKKENIVQNKQPDISKYISPKNKPGTSKIVTLKDLTNPCSSGGSCDGNSSNKIKNPKKLPSPKPQKNKKKISNREESTKSILDLVREHWANKYPELEAKQKQDKGDETKCTKNVKKGSKSEGDSVKTTIKRPKVDNVNNSITNYMPNFKPPKKAEREDILKDIYGDDFKLTNKYIKKDDQPNKPMPNIIVSNSSNSKTVKCPSCFKLVQENDINDHLDLCILQNSNRLSPSLQNNVKSSTSGKRKSSPKYYETSKQRLSPVPLSEDLGKLSPLKKYEIKDDNPELQLLTCPVCNKKISNQLDEHLEDCVSNFFQDESEHVPESIGDTTVSLLSDDDDLDESQEFNATGTKFPCPCCFAMVEAESMNAHLDTCLI